MSAAAAAATVYVGNNIWWTDYDCRGRLSCQLDDLSSHNAYQQCQHVESGLAATL